MKRTLLILVLLSSCSENRNKPLSKESQKRDIASSEDKLKKFSIDVDNKQSINAFKTNLLVDLDIQQEDIINNFPKSLDLTTPGSISSPKDIWTREQKKILVDDLNPNDSIKSEEFLKNLKAVLKSRKNNKFREDVFRIELLEVGLRLTFQINNELKKELVQKYEYIKVDLNNQQEYLVDFEKELGLIIESKELGDINKISVFGIERGTNKQIKIQSYDYRKRKTLKQNLNKSPFKSNSIENNQIQKKSLHPRNLMNTYASETPLNNSDLALESVPNFGDISTTEQNEHSIIDDLNPNDSMEPKESSENLDTASNSPDLTILESIPNFGDISTTEQNEHSIIDDLNPNDSMEPKESSENLDTASNSPDLTILESIPNFGDISTTEQNEHSIIDDLNPNDSMEPKESSETPLNNSDLALESVPNFGDISTTEQNEHSIIDDLNPNDSMEPKESSENLDTASNSPDLTILESVPNFGDISTTEQNEHSIIDDLNPNDSIESEKVLSNYIIKENIEKKLNFKLKIISSENNTYTWNLNDEETVVILETAIKISLEEDDRKDYTLYVNGKEIENNIIIMNNSDLKLVHRLSNAYKEKKIEFYRKDIDLNNIFKIDFYKMTLSLNVLDEEMQEYLKERFYTLTLNLNNHQKIMYLSDFFENKNHVVDIRKNFKGNFNKAIILNLSLNEYFSHDNTKVCETFIENFYIKIDDIRYELKDLDRFKKNIKISRDEDEIFIMEKNVEKAVEEVIIKKTSKIVLKREDRRIEKIIDILKLDLNNIVHFDENNLTLSINNPEYFSQIQKVFVYAKGEENILDSSKSSLKLQTLPYKPHLLNDIEIEVFVHEFHDDRKKIQNIRIEKEQIKKYTERKIKEKEYILRKKIMKLTNKNDNNNLLSVINNQKNEQYFEGIRFKGNKTLSHLIFETGSIDLISSFISYNSLIPLTTKRDDSNNTALHYLPMKDEYLEIWRKINSEANYNDKCSLELLNLASLNNDDRVFELLVSRRNNVLNQKSIEKLAVLLKNNHKIDLLESYPKYNVEKLEELFINVLNQKSTGKLVILLKNDYRIDLSEYYFEYNEYDDKINFLHKFIIEKEDILVKLLLENKIIKINSFTKNRKNVLHIFSENFSKEVWNLFRLNEYENQLKDLINKNIIEVSYQGLKLLKSEKNEEKEFEPLYYAIRSNSIEATQFLISLGAKLDIYFGRNHSLIYAAEIALKEKDLDVVFKIAQNILGDDDKYRVNRKKSLEQIFSSIEDLKNISDKSSLVCRSRTVLSVLGDAKEKELFIKALEFAENRRFKVEVSHSKTILHYAVDFEITGLFENYAHAVIKSKLSTEIQLINYTKYGSGYKILPVAIYALNEGKFEFLKKIIKDKEFKFNLNEKFKMKSEYIISETISSLLHELAKVRTFDENHQEILDTCLYRNDINDCDFKDNEGNTPIFYFKQNGNMEAIQKLANLKKPFQILSKDM